MSTTNINDTDDEMDAIIDVLNQGDLVVEIFWSAMHYLKNNPTKSIPEAIDYGISEWIK